MYSPFLLVVIQDLLYTSTSSCSPRKSSVQRRSCLLGGLVDLQRFVLGYQRGYRLHNMFINSVTSYAIPLTADLLRLFKSMTREI